LPSLALAARSNGPDVTLYSLARKASQPEPALPSQGRHAKHSLVYSNQLENILAYPSQPASQPEPRHRGQAVRSTLVRETSHLKLF